jgi:hypothetical protein
MIESGIDSGVVVLDSGAGWQDEVGIVLFDGGRRKRVLVKIIGE